jgi:hypothetical protein
MKNAILSLMMVSLVPVMVPASLFAQVSRVVTNGELQPERAFHLLVMHDVSPASGRVVAMLQQPRSDMQTWAQNLDVKLLNCEQPQDLIVAKSHHGDLLAKHRNQLPIVAMVDGTGGVWWSAASADVPRTESEMAGKLMTAYQATIEAANEAGLNPPIKPANRPAQAGPTIDGSYFLRRKSVDERPHLFNPKLDVAVPDRINTEFTLATNVIILLIGGGFIAIVCCLILSIGRVVAAALQPDGK